MSVKPFRISFRSFVGTLFPARDWRLVGLAAFCAITLSCSQGSSPFPITPVDIVDLYPTWSPTDSVIAFYRGAPSSYGPPGVYLISSNGGNVRRLRGDDPYPIVQLSFSPDGRQLAGVRAGEVVTLDISANVLTTQVYSPNVPTDPAWSPDGANLVYSHVFLGRGEPPDSSGIHIVNLATNADRPLLPGSNATYGDHPVWSPDGSLIAFAGGGIQLIRPDGGGLRTVVFHSDQGYYSPTWIDHGARLLYLATGGSQSGTRVVGRDGTNDRSWGSNYGGMYSVSADGGRAVFTSTMKQANGRLALVLFTQHTSDLLGGTRRQLTQYVP